MKPCDFIEEGGMDGASRYGPNRRCRYDGYDEDSFSPGPWIKKGKRHGRKPA